MKRVNTLLIITAAVALIIILSIVILKYRNFGIMNYESGIKNETQETVNSNQKAENDEQKADIIKAKLSIAFLDETHTYEFESDEIKTAFDLLLLAKKNDKITLETKQYDFGVFVESIDGVANSADFVWIYYVNNQSANVGADSHQLKNGDVVEWRYEEPNF